MGQIPLTSGRDGRLAADAAPSRRRLIISGTVFATGILTAILAAAAALMSWYRTEMIITAGGISGAMFALAVVLLYRQTAAQRVAHRALREIEARVGGIVESAMDAIVTVDQRQRIVLFNQAAEQVFGYTRAAVLGESLDMLLPARFRDLHREHVRGFGETRITSRRMGEKRVLTGLRASGQEFPVEASISQSGAGEEKVCTVILRDITERVRAEELLVQSEARLRGILDSAMDAIITVDERQEVVLFNQAAEAVFGFSRGEAIGSPLEQFIPERFRAAHGAHVRRFGKTSTTRRRMGAQRIVIGLRRNGEEFPIDASISQITENGQKFYTVILRDVTERVRAEEALSRSKEELHALATAANQLREQEKRRIARELHDELAQALTGLKMDTAWIKDKWPALPRPIVDKLEAMEGLLDSTVAATRRISSDLRPMMLDDLGLIPAVEWLVQNFSERTGIRCEAAVANPELELRDPYATTVYRVLQESLTNIGKHAQASSVEVTLEHNGGEVVISVRDNGVGFSPQDPRKPDSYGLIGLRERVYLLGGKVRIDSAPGKGTYIEVRLPAVRGTP